MRTRTSKGRFVPQLVSSLTVGARLGVTDRHIRKLAEAGEIPGMLVGEVWRFDLDAVLAAVAEKTRTRVLARNGKEGSL